MSVKAEHYDIIRKPLVTEKSTMASENGAVVFEVSIDSNKPQIKEAVKHYLVLRLRRKYFYYKRKKSVLRVSLDVVKM